MFASVIAFSGSCVQAGPYSPLPGQPGSTAVSASSTSIVEWASGATVARGWRDIENPTFYSPDANCPLNFAFFGGSDGASDAASAASIAAGAGPISTTDNSAPIGQPPQPQTTGYAVALGQNGYATLTFATPIINGPGADFAVFGNGFSTGSQEWCKPALVAVSSDGVHFFQFPSVSLTQTATQVGNYDQLDPTNLYDIAGNFPAGYGTPFDLSELASVSPLLNVNDITQVRVISIAGDINPAYATKDSTGNIINSPWPAASEAGSEGFCLAAVGVINALTTVNLLVWSNAVGTGIWNVNGDANWNQPGVVYTNASAITFDNSFTSANQIVVLNSVVSPTSLLVNNSGGSYTIKGTGGIAGTTGLTKSGSQRLILAISNSYSGATVVNAGTVELAAASALPANAALTIAAGAQVIMDRGTGVMILSSLNLDPTSTGSPVGKLDLTDNALVVHNGSLAQLNAAVKTGANQLAWTGSSGITSSTAAGDSQHLTALGIIENSSADGSATYTSAFAGATDLNLSSSDVLVRFTYYGDANLDGQVDGSDYSLIDSGYANHLTGWQNGDFNYDGIVDGSDYTLIDNAFNRQGAAFTDAVATTQVAQTTVPESAGAFPMSMGMAALTRRRRKLSRVRSCDACVASFPDNRSTATQASQPLKNRTPSHGFTIIELLVVTGIIGLLIAIFLPSLFKARQQAQLTVCQSNIHQLVLANLLYAGDNHSFCVVASADIFNDLGDGEGGHYRWHGTRDAAGKPFDASRGPLAPYLAAGGAVKSCPLFDPSLGVITGNNFENGCGGYGYNEVYVGGRMDLYGYSPQAVATSAKLPQILHAPTTVMFTDAGMAQPIAYGGTGAIVSEYSFCEPPFDQENPGSPSSDMAWPSIHFRHHGRASVAWADGHVSAESLTFTNESYGLTPTQVRAAGVGWFGTSSNGLFEVLK